MLASILEPVGVGQHAEIHGTKSTGAIREPERRRIEVHRAPHVGAEGVLWRNHETTREPEGHHMKKNIAVKI